MSLFAKVPPVEKDPIFRAQQKCKEAKSEGKINLTVGMIKGDNINNECIYEFECTKKAQAALADDKSFNKEYPPITGHPEFNATVQELFLGKDHPLIKENRVMTFQTITGGAALRIGADLIRRLYTNKMYVSNSTWSCYNILFKEMEVMTYPYYNEKQQALDVDNMLNFFENIEMGSVVNFQLCGHNPTGLDLMNSQWETLAAILKKRNVFAFVDIAYLGYGSGNIHTDLEPVHILAKHGIEMFVAWSSAKCFGTYSDDVGVLMAIVSDSKYISPLKGHCIVMCRSSYSFPSLYAPRLLLKVLKDEQLSKLWGEEIQKVCNSIVSKREKVIKEFERLNAKINIDFLKKQRGIYLFLDLNLKQGDYLADKHNVHITPGGRCSISWIDDRNIVRFAEAVKDCMDQEELKK